MANTLRCSGTRGSPSGVYFAVGFSTAGGAEMMAPPGGELVEWEEAQLEIVVAASANFGARPRPPPLHRHATCFKLDKS